MLRPFVVALHASSSCPRCLQVLANARTRPFSAVESSPRTNRIAFGPVPTAFWLPTAARSQA